MNNLIKFGIIQLIALVFLIFFMTILFRQSKALKYEKRLGPFSLDPYIDEATFLDKAYTMLWKIIKSISSFLSKLKFLDKFASKYERYITYEEKDLKSNLDYLSVKFMLTIFIISLYTISLLIGINKFNIATFIITILVAFFAPNIYWNYTFAQKKKQVENDLLKAIIIMNNSFKAGNNVIQAVETVIAELDGPIKDEFRKIHVDINYGLSLDVVFERFYDRVKLKEAKLLTTSLALLNKTGGNIVKIFTLIEKSFFDTQRLKNELRSQTASSLFVFRFLLVLPVAFIILILLLNPAYFSPLFEHKLGALVIITAFILYCTYYFIIKRIMRIKL